MSARLKPRIFLFRFHSHVLVNVARELKKKEVEIVYWSDEKYFFDEISRGSEFPNTIFHSTFDATLGVPARGVDTSQFPPVSKELSREFLECESQTIRMMDTLDPDIVIPVAKKKHFYYNYLRYWYGTLAALKPDAILFGDIPHIAYQYVVYCIAKKFGIKTIMYDSVKRIPDRLLFFDDFKTYSELEQAYKNLKKDVAFSDLSPDLQEYYKKQTDRTVDSSPVFLSKDFIEGVTKNSWLIPPLRIIVKNVKSLTIFRTSVSYVKMLFSKRKIKSLDGTQEYFGLEFKLKLRAWNRIKKQFKKDYEKLQTNVDYSKKFIYVALHSQPERSTSAEGDIFTDQILLIDILRASIPDGWVLYVKESPFQWAWPRTHVGRYKGYYEEIARMKNVYLIPVDTSAYDLIEKCESLATVNGTVGWEAALRGKPVLVFGYTWYAHCHGTFKISDVNSAKSAIEKIQQGFKPDQQKVINFLEAIDRVCIQGHDHHRLNVGAPIPEEVTIKNIADEYYRRIKLAFDK